MNNMTITSGWRGTGVARLAGIGGPAIPMARPRQDHTVVFGDGTARPRSGVQQLA